MVVLHRAMDLFRAQQRAYKRLRVEQALGMARTETPEFEAILERLSAEVDATYALTVLEPETRRLVELRFRHGYSHEDLSTLTGLSETAIASRIRRGLQLMARALEARDEMPLRERHGT